LLKGKCDVAEELKRWLADAKMVVVAGIGNPIRMDDFVGTRIVQDLQGRVSNRVLLIECETIPEDYIQQITDFKPTHVLLIDAAILGLKSGDSRLVNPEQLTNFPAFSTHLLPLRLFTEYLTKTTKARIALLLIEPKETDFGEGLSPEVALASQSLTDTLLDVLPKKPVKKVKR
jgi:hydrogenase 3 maturation protease